MKIQIRKNVFETNSSSVHTITIAKNTDVILPSEITIKGDGEFGWEHDLYNDMQTKLEYFWIAMNSYPEYTFKNHKIVYVETEMVKSMFKDNLKKFKRFFLKRGIMINLPYNGKVKVTSYDFTPDRFYVSYAGTKGYIDHGDSARTLVDTLLKDEDMMEKFFFSENSYIETGNDNDDYTCLTPDVGPSLVITKGN